MTLQEAEAALPAAVVAHEAAVVALLAAKALIAEGDISEPALEVRSQLAAAYAEHLRTSKARADAEARVAAERVLFGLS